MFKQSSRTHLKLLTLVAACILFAAGSATAQYKGLKLITKTIDPTKEALLANPAVDIDQCANGPASSPVQCAGSAWQNGNLNENQSHYVEGDSVPYRDKFTSLQVGGTYTVTIEWDTTKSGKHAIDYLTTYDRTETTADACSDVNACAAPMTTFPIPTDPKVTAGQDQIPGNGDDIGQIPGVFTMWGGTITGVSDYTYTGTYAGDSSTSITITFTANSSTVVLAWGGHIATRLNWGFDNSAVAISGSPYHMRNLALTGPGVTGNLGNQDRSLSATAVFFPAFLTIIKEVNVPGGVSSIPFEFVASPNFGPPTTFSLIDDGTLGNDRTSRSYTVSPGEITVLESPAGSNWTLTAVTCSINSGGGSTVGTAVGDPGNRQATINLNEANIATCTFTNTGGATTAATGSVSGRVMTQAGMGIRGALVTVFDASTNTTKTAITNTFGYYRFTELPVENFYVMNVGAKRYTFSGPPQTFTLHGDVADINFTSDQ